MDLTEQNTGRISNDYSFVDSTARIALYDDLFSSPRIIEIEPALTTDFIGKLSSSIYEQARSAGGSIPFTIIQQVTENFIHAYFTEMVVSIMDNGNTIRFSDQGPGITDKEKAQRPGYSSATYEMKKYINGVGSGLPIVREYLDMKNGTIQIEDNMNTGAVVTISLVEHNNETNDKSKLINKKSNDLSDKTEINTETSISQSNKYFDSNQNSSIDPNKLLIASLSKRAISILFLFKNQEILGVSDVAKEINIANSSVYSEFKKLEELGLISKIGTKRVITDLGLEILDNL